ncbi:homeobox and c2h2 transcription factor [Grosmannia clavigera kw1407]|uniref:Homeobox and c2h2 transcription factor n=1 Tax=Grosmannia clavigera (strain kw1407 / UAMH 11150) TaxID=655863 RepID=F0XGD1_GROCL|nr:homeobox and c2h2 transcription factor [Grosmannia clavigera kw1407]EFX03246.1 homeobox and c2h2 transcription factor [Grosmannia clavigera kw1407]
MPVIPEEHVSPNMDDFVNWDNAGSPADAMMADDGGSATFCAGIPPELVAVAVASQPSDDRAALMFENPDADDFSFWALEHYDQSNSPGAAKPVGLLDDGIAAADCAHADGGASAIPEEAHDFCPIEVWDVPGEPCTHCKTGGYQCKTIQEGSYKGYCTSCVALRCECSFGLASGGPLPTSISFPPNPWPTLGDHPDPIPHDHVSLAVHSSSAPDNAGWAGQTGSQPSDTAAQPKLGARFSRDSVKILKNWVSTHSRHPYPTEEEKESLQHLTGLNKTQISNWLANARRRGKIPTTRSTSPHVRNSWSGTGAVDIPQNRRSGTPSPFDRKLQQLDNILLQRWANSPPENEPASVTDIARAITSSSSAVSSGLNSPYSYNFTDDGSGRSLFNGSSASSAGTSHSSGGGSFASAFSHGSRGSLNSFGSLGRGRRRRRRRSAPLSGLGFGGGSGEEREPGSASSGKGLGGDKGRTRPTTLQPLLKTYQCTFCTETFKTKHDWQRHEKSLHLSLERWVCAPQGAVAVHPDTKLPSCVFCGEASPNEGHVESHNFTACQERSMGDRTFYRKDHLRQHLKLVHGVNFVGWAMDPWKIATPEIRSRCGFCGIVMDTWSFRVDHLADHFKTGRTMADWKGDWGFEDPVLQMVENSIPPYLIHNERNTPLPFTANAIPPHSPRNSYELLTGELSYWLQMRAEEGKTPTETEMLVEACRVIFGADMLARNSNNINSPSWLRDLLMSNEDCKQHARLSPIRSALDSQMATIRINGKGNIFDSCPLEAGLQDFVVRRAQLGLTPMNAELRAEATRIVGELEAQLVDEAGKSADAGFRRAPFDKCVVDFILRLVEKTTSWLTAFRQRAHLPRAEAIADETRRPVDDPKSIDAAVHNEARLEAELSDFVRQQMEAGKPAPDDAALQRQARLIIYELDDGWNQTAADGPEWLTSFKSKHIPQLARELTRYVTAAMSPNNPNCHVPTDEELQHQARWILYDDDDPWNQTAADNAEWLMRFKRDSGILPTSSGPGLMVESQAWNVKQGGTGFAPPYCFPNMPMAPFKTPPGAENSSGDSDHKMIVLQLQDGDVHRGVQYELASSAANKFLQSFKTRYAKPATVFCSRELENGLTYFVHTAVHNGDTFPDDMALRNKAREILGCSSSSGITPADDGVLLAKFKEMMRTNLSEERQEASTSETAIPVDTNIETNLDFSFDDTAMDLNLSSVTQTDIDTMLQDMNFDFEMGTEYTSAQ